MKSSYSGFPEGLPIMLEPSGPNFAPHPTPSGSTSFRPDVRPSKSEACDRGRLSTPPDFSRPIVPYTHQSHFIDVLVIFITFLLHLCTALKVSIFHIIMCFLCSFITLLFKITAIFRSTTGSPRFGTNPPACRPPRHEPCRRKCHSGLPQLRTPCRPERRGLPALIPIP